MSSEFRIRAARNDDLEQVAALEKEVWGAGAASLETLTKRFDNSPKGNYLAVTPDERICGYTAVCFLDYEEYEARNACSWYDLSGDGTASTNVDGAPDMFGINLGCTKWAPKGASQALLVQTVRCGVKRGVRRGFLGARLPRYHRYADKMTAQEYAVAEKKPGVALDPELRYYYGFGMKPTRLVEDYFVDPESLDWGMIVEMQNPFYRPAPLRLVGKALAALPIDLARVIERLEH